MNLSKTRLVLLAILTLSPIALADQPGRWAKAGSPAQVNVGCIQVWRCGPSEDVMYDASKRLVATDNESTVGVCSAGDGPIDSCNVCLASQPEKACTWHLE